MDSSPGDDEAPRDPGALKIHQPSYTDEDFEGKLLFVIEPNWNLFTSDAQTFNENERL